MFSRRHSVPVLTAAALLFATATLADDELTTLAPAASASPAPIVSLGSTAVSAETLGTETAKAQIQIDKLIVNEQNLNGLVQGNTAINSQNGNNNVSGDSFSDSAGFMTVIQNTGNNVLIQNSTIVNIALEP